MPRAALAARSVTLGAILINESAVGDVGLTMTRDEVALFQRTIPVFAMHREEPGDEVLSAIARACGLTG